jgi:hypothetical protein
MAGPNECQWQVEPTPRGDLLGVSLPKLLSN